MIGIRAQVPAAARMIRGFGSARALDEISQSFPEHAARAACVSER